MGAGRDASSANPFQAGTTTLTAKGDQTEVALNLTPGPASVSQPAFMHNGSCPVVSGVKYTLTAVLDGKSTTMVNVALADVLKAGPYAVVVHKSSQEAGIQTTCGNVPSTAPTATPTARPTATPTATPTAAPTTPPSTFQVTVANFALPNITAPVGTTIVWTNKDSLAHTVTSGRNGVFDGTGWNSAVLDPGQTFSFTFTKTGTFNYTCRVHPELNSTVTVNQSGPTSSTAGTPGTSGDYYTY